MRERYAELVAHPERIEETLIEGALKARAVAAPLLRELREAVGLRRMVAVGAQPSASIVASTTASAALTVGATVKAKAALPMFKQYREADGRFYFKLAAADGRLLLQSAAFDAGRDAGQWVARLKADGVTALAEAPVQRSEGVSVQDVADALAVLAALAAA